MLTAPFGEPAVAVAWRAVDMVLRRPVVVVFDAAGDDADGDRSVPFDSEPPADVPVGDVLDGGHHAEGFYRVFRTTTDTTSPDEPADDADAAAPAEESRLVLPLFGAIDGADATRPMDLPAAASGGFRPPPLDAVPLPVDPTTELPRPAAGSDPAGPSLPPPPVPAPLPALSRPVHGARRPRRGSPLPVSVTAVTVVGVVGLGGYLLARPSPSGSSPGIGPPAAAAANHPTTTTTVVEETTTTETTVPETTTTLPPPTTWRRVTTVTQPPDTEPPETAPPPTAPPTSPPRPTTTPPRPTTRPRQTTTTRPPVTLPGGFAAAEVLGLAEPPG